MQPTQSLGLSSSFDSMHCTGLEFLALWNIFVLDGELVTFRQADKQNEVELRNDLKQENVLQPFRPAANPAIRLSLVMKRSRFHRTMAMHLTK